MSQIVTPEEMAALFEGLREAEDGPGSPYCHAPQESPAKSRILSEPCRIKNLQDSSTWLMALPDLRWHHL